MTPQAPPCALVFQDLEIWRISAMVAEILFVLWAKPLPESLIRSKSPAAGQRAIRRALFCVSSKMVGDLSIGS